MPDSSEGDLRLQLRKLHREAGGPTIDRLKEHADLRGHSVGRATLATVLNGPQAMRWATVAAFVDACASYAARRRPLAPEAIDLVAWRQLFERVPRGRRSRQPPEAQAGRVQRELVEADIAPDRLVDRARELDELEAFCTGDEPYWWWQAGPWAGKTALLSWFALHVPPGVDVVSFFVTGGLAGQSDSDAAIDSVIRQLAAIAEQPVDPAWPAHTRRGHLSRLLKDAAERCVTAGRRLLLIMDGLDEDTSKRGGAQRDSVASLLPRHPPPGVRVLVASRPNPDLPADVRPDHPLRRVTPRPLPPYQHANDLEGMAKAELMRILDGPPLPRDILGILAACGGGLTMTDLEQLTGRAKYELEGEFDSVFGRSLTKRHLFGEEAYLFAHDTLRETAVERYGTSLADYRDRLHDWAKKYQDDDWPADTPKYLLRGYFSILHATGDVARMVACATDPARRDRMLDLSGGDSAALAEIITTQDVIAAQEHPDVIAMVRLAIHRDHLIDQNSNIPSELPSVWVLLGQVNRAEAMARSITNPRRQAEALARVAEAVAEAGNPDQAEAIARSITDPRRQGEALARMVEAAAEAGDLDRAGDLVKRAEAIARSITDPVDQVGVLARVVEAAGETGNLDRVAMLLNRADAIADSITEPGQRTWNLASVVEAAAKAGNPDRIATPLVKRAEAMARSITDPVDQADALARVVEVAAEAGDLDRVAALVKRAEAVARSITNPDQQANALAWLAKAVARVGDLDRATALVKRAEAIARSITKPDQQGWALARVVETAVMAGKPDRVATALIKRAEAIARSITTPHQQEWALARVAEAAAKGGNHDQAEAIARSMTDTYQQAKTLVRLAEAAAEAGNPDRAEAIACSITSTYEQAKTLVSVAKAAAKAGNPGHGEAIADFITIPYWQVEALVSVAEAAAEAGKSDRVVALVKRAEAIAAPIIDPNLLARMAEAVAKAGDPDRATALIKRAAAIARSITNPDRQVEAWASVAEAVAEAGNPVRAAVLVERAEAIVRSSIDVGSEEETDAVARVAEAAAKAGNPDRAEAIARSITDPDRQVEVLARVAEAVAKAGNPDRAEAIARSITNPYQQAWALASVAEAVAEAGNPDRAAVLVKRAEAVARSITDPVELVGVLARVVEAVAEADNLDRATILTQRAEAVARSITIPDEQVNALARVAEAAAKAGNFDRATALVKRAEAIARSSIDVGSDVQAWALVRVAEAVAKAGNPDRAEAIADSITRPNEQARALLAVTTSKNLRRRACAVARVLRIADWHFPLRQLIEIEPEALAVVVAEFDVVTRPDTS